MKVQVLKPFRDRQTRVVHRPGDQVDVSEARVAEINGTVYGTLVGVLEPPATAQALVPVEDMPDAEGLIPAPELIPEPEDVKPAKRTKKG